VKEHSIIKVVPVRSDLNGLAVTAPIPTHGNSNTPSLQYSTAHTQFFCRTHNPRQLDSAPNLLFPNVLVFQIHPLLFLDVDICGRDRRADLPQ
jgi:hypothetical protein